MSSTRSGPRLSTPKEHGGLVTLGAAGLLATAVSPEPLRALVAAGLFLVAFLARGPTERRTRGFRPRPWDLGALFIYGLAGAGATFALAQTNVALAASAAVLAAALIAGGAIAQQRRIHRSLGIELLGMASAGLAAGLAIVIGGGTAGLAAIVAFSMITYACSSVLVVRAQLRKLSSQTVGAYNWMGLCAIAIGAAIASGYEPFLFLVFAPRCAYIGYRNFVPARPSSPYMVAASETAQLALFAVGIAVVIAVA